MAIQQAINQMLTTAAIGAGAGKKISADAAELKRKEEVEKLDIRGQYGELRKGITQDYTELVQNLSDQAKMGDQLSWQKQAALLNAERSLKDEIVLKNDRMMQLQKRFAQLGGDVQHLEGNELFSGKPKRTTGGQE